MQCKGADESEIHHTLLSVFSYWMILTLFLSLTFLTLCTRSLSPSSVFSSNSIGWFLISLSLTYSLHVLPLPLPSPSFILLFFISLSPHSVSSKKEMKEFSFCLTFLSHVLFLSLLFVSPLRLSSSFSLSFTFFSDHEEFFVVGSRDWKLWN